MKKAMMILVLIATLLVSGCNFPINASQVVKGSGVLASQVRQVSTFNAVELAGFGDVRVQMGEQESVQVETDDNLIPFIQTDVRSGKLVIRSRNNTTLITQKGIRVYVTVKSLSQVKLSGSGKIFVENLSADSMLVDLPGSGNIDIAGAANRLSATLDGSGNIQCGKLAADSVSARLNGSGNITVFASKKLDAAIKGSGNVKFTGAPVEVKQMVSGSGNIIAMP